MARTKDFDEKEVLIKAVMLFWHKGYNGTSIDDLVETLGISRSSLYRTYADKHTLFLKALDNYKQFTTREILGAINEADAPQRNILRLLEFITKEVTSDKQQKGCLMVNTEVEMSLHDKEVHDMVIANDQVMEDTFYRLIKKGQGKGEVNNKRSARALARFFLNTAKGIRVTAKSTTDKIVFKNIIQMSMSALN